MAKLTLSDNFKKFHLGCGGIFIPEFLNIGLWDDLPQGALFKDEKSTNNQYVLNFDLSNGIPADDDSLDVVYHSHLLEHLSAEQGIIFLSECYRSLKSGGILRIVVPDLFLWSKKYQESDNFFFNSYRRFALKNDFEKYPTNGTVFMGMLHNHGHKMGYDYQTLDFILDRIGFKKIERKLVQDSALENISVIEPYSPDRAMESLCLECYK